MRCTRMRLATAAVAAVGLAATVLPAGAAGGVVVGRFGPAWGRFTAAFPSTPSVCRTSCLDAAFGPGTEGAAYYVSKQKHLLGNVPVPPVNSFLTTAVRLSTARETAGVLATLEAHVTDGTAVERNGYQGVLGVGTFVKGLYIDARGTGRGPVGGMEALAKGRVLMLALCITRAPAGAHAFLNAFRPLA